MTDSSQMVFTFGAFLLIENTDSRVIEGGNISGKPNSSSQVRRAALRDMSVGFLDSPD